VAKEVESSYLMLPLPHWAIPFNACTPPPIEGQGNPRGREGVSKVISEEVAMSVPLISRKHLLFF